MVSISQDVGVVVIGRNEGPRLQRCLRSLARHVQQLVYVDSGSTDGSLDFAMGAGVHVVQLDASKPFSAARARNAGFESLLTLQPSAKYVQFVDGDCEMISGWIERGAAEMEAQPRLAAVCGRLQEKHPRASVYNRLCDMEWNTGLGEIRACGGIAMFRAEAFAAVGGFNDALVAGEEPELCTRLRERGWSFARVGAEMAYHDASMARFGQWWKRAVRSGHAYAEGLALHGRIRGAHNARQIRSALLWSVAMPAVLFISVGLSLWSRRWLIAAMIALALYAVLILRVFRYRRNLGDRTWPALLYTSFLFPAKLAQCSGAMRYWLNDRRGQRAGIFEYK